LYKGKDRKKNLEEEKKTTRHEASTTYNSTGN
jgi:hypothetical protein